MANINFDEGYNPSQIDTIAISGPVQVSLETHNRRAIDVSGWNCNLSLDARVLTIQPMPGAVLNLAPDRRQETIEIMNSPSLTIKAPSGTHIVLDMHLESEITTHIP